MLIAGFEQLYYAHTDHLGTPKLLTNAVQHMVWSADYDPFGNTTAIDEDVDLDGINVRLNIRFPGQYFDAETGLYYNWNRYYDPEIGQYTTSDPIGIDGGLNTYAYVGGNPVGFVDPEGLKIYGVSFGGSGSIFGTGWVGGGSITFAFDSNGDFAVVATPEGGAGFGSGAFIRGVYGPCDSQTVSDLKGSGVSISGSGGPVSGSVTWPVSISDTSVADFKNPIIEFGYSIPRTFSISFTGAYGFELF